MVGFTLLIVVVAAGITALLAGARAAALTALVIAILPPVQRYCYQFGADLPATAFAGGALLAALRARATGNRWWWSAAGASMALALGAKLIAIFVGPSLLLLLLAGSLRGRGPRRALADLGAAAAGFAAACLAVVLLIRPPRAALAQIVNFHLQDTSGIRTSPTRTLTDLVLLDDAVRARHRGRNGRGPALAGSGAAHAAGGGGVVAGAGGALRSAPQPDPRNTN